MRVCIKSVKRRPSIRREPALTARRSRARCGVRSRVTSVTLAKKAIVCTRSILWRNLRLAQKRGDGRRSSAKRVGATVGDATQLPFADRSFDLVVMLGVTEWVTALGVAGERSSPRDQARRPI